MTLLVLDVAVAQYRDAIQQSAPPSSSNFAYPQSLFVDSQNGHLWVTDFDYHRVLRFDVSQLTAVEVTRSAAVPRNMFLSQNYPNPFNPQTQISFSVERNGPVSLRMYNLLGQTVATLFNETATAHTLYSITANGKDLSSGIYLYVLRSEEGSLTRRMCLVK
ncbi:MAG: T9SS type A sorting domain-containing protein [Bacteroidota bacterium]